jgi:hypothetical protein
MDILVALKQEQVKLQQQLKGIQGAIAALNGAHPVSHKGVHRKRRMSAAGRARISKLTKDRWAKFRAEKAKKGK